jgi:hypothetical protein
MATHCSPTQMLVQKEPSRGDVRQRYQEVTQTGLDDVTGVHAPHVHQPIDRQQRPAEQVHPQDAPRPQRFAHLRHRSLQDHQRRNHH